ncbi:hypothetical protein LMG29542_07160 [Paraburkholderia humisilvae]|uniref:Uncharacterized protein n=1 Tax=Paraburkholderia humisilvae TaxID=627669 RepID=A0A6J5F341_9BURK|nr:hypothetical protein LMG29542_07160 [Paraburkholderia humisilvae]
MASASDLRVRCRIAGPAAIRPSLSLGRWVSPNASGLLMLLGPLCTVLAYPLESCPLEGGIGARHAVLGRGYMLGHCERSVLDFLMWLGEKSAKVDHW